MHEISLMRNIFQLVDTYSRTYRLQHISRIVVRIGELTCVAPDALQFAFAAISPGTVAAGADFIIESVAARAQCTVCGHEFAPGFTIPMCPQCGKPAILVAGRELCLHTLEGDQEEEEHEN